jgi:hypothetical protein
MKKSNTIQKLNSLPWYRVLVDKKGRELLFVRISKINEFVSSKTTLTVKSLESSVADPNPNPDSPDPHIFGPVGSGSFHHQAKIVRKTLIPTAL